jgi:hypothetical protein
MFSLPISAQVIHSPVNTALGGGGTAYLTGLDALFVNPANLYIQERSYRVQFLVGQTGNYLSSPLGSTNSTDQVQNFRNHFLTFNPDNLPSTESGFFSRLLSRSYSDELQIAEFTARSDFHWLGVHWAGQNRSYAIAIRSRIANRYTVGRAYYDGVPVIVNDDRILDFSVTQQFQSFHEISFGYAESFTFMNGLWPQLSELIIGIAPKFVLSGAYQNLVYNNIYTQRGTDQYDRTHSFDYYSSGMFTDAARRYRAGQDSDQTIRENLRASNLFNPTGYGAGVDIGITYLITLGDDLSTVRESDASTQKSLRVSLAVTDVGFVSYFKNPVTITSNEISQQNQLVPGRSDFIFRGAPGEHFFFLEQESHPILDSGFNNSEDFITLLPTALHAGALFQINRIKLMGDLSLGLTNNAFNTTKLITYLGVELRPLPNVPIRAGTRLATQIPGYYSFGSGIETCYFDFNAAIQLRSRAIGPTSELTGAAIAAFRFYIP